MTIMKMNSIMKEMETVVEDTVDADYGSSSCRIGNNFSHAIHNLIGCLFDILIDETIWRNIRLKVYLIWLWYLLIILVIIKRSSKVFQNLFVLLSKLTRTLKKSIDWVGLTDTGTGIHFVTHGKLGQLRVPWLKPFKNLTLIRRWEKWSIEQWSSWEKELLICCGTLTLIGSPL